MSSGQKSGWPASSRSIDRPGQPLGDAAPFGERVRVDLRDDQVGGLQRALEAHHDIVDDRRIDHQLAVGEELDQHPAQEIVVGPGELDLMERAQGAR